VGVCTKQKICFIYATPDHYMTACPKWKKLPSTSYMGSAGKGLGFYHIDLPKVETTLWLNITNCGVVNIRKGVMSMSELEKELSEIFCKDWSWQIRELTSSKFLVRFSPHRKVVDIKFLPSFNLRKEGVCKLKWLNGYVSLISSVNCQRCGSSRRGSSPDWRVFAQVASSFGQFWR
jgi:hypothetical protein